MDTIRVERGNVILDIPVEDKADYMKKGFSVIDTKTGKVIEEAMSNDVNTLQAQVATLKNKVVELEGVVTAYTEENKELKTQLESLRAVKPSTTKKKSE